MTRVEVETCILAKVKILFGQFYFLLSSDVIEAEYDFDFIHEHLEE